MGEPHAIELVSGTQTAEFEHVFHEQGLHALSFEISNDRDTLTQNNIFNSYIYLEVFDDLLIIERPTPTSPPPLRKFSANSSTSAWSTYSTRKNCRPSLTS